MKKLSGKHFPAAVLKEVNDNMAMEELQQVQELEKELAVQYAAAQADAKRRIAVVQELFRHAGCQIFDYCVVNSAPLPERSRTAAATPTWRCGS